MKKVILSLTTLPSRLAVPHSENTLKKALHGLEKIKYKNYEININIPFIYRKTSEKYIVPQWLSDMKLIKIFRTDDYGPATKLVPTVMRETNPNSIIIVLDDDIEYHDDFVEKHIEKQEIYKNCAIGFAGIESVNPNICYFCTARNEDVEVNILEGYKTVSFQRNFFNDDFQSFITENMSWDDDMLTSAYLAKEGIRRIAISHEGETDNTPRANSYPVKNLLYNDPSGCNLERIKNVPNGREKMEKYFVHRPL